MQPLDDVEVPSLHRPIHRSGCPSLYSVVVKPPHDFEMSIVRSQIDSIRPKSLRTVATQPFQRVKLPIRRSGTHQVRIKAIAVVFVQPLQHRYIPSRSSFIHCNPRAAHTADLKQPFHNAKVATADGRVRHLWSTRLRASFQLVQLLQQAQISTFRCSCHRIRRVGIREVLVDPLHRAHMPILRSVS
jgi:hypothetical protein